MRSAALQYLLQSNDSRAIEAVSDIIRSEDKHTGLRVEAIRSVGHKRVGMIEAVDALVDALEDNAKRIRRLAADALGDIGDASAIEALLNVLSKEDIDTETKSVVVSALGKFQASRAHSSRVVDTLLKVLETKTHDEGVRANAARNLGGFNQHESINVLASVAESEEESPVVRAAAVQALGHLASEGKQEWSDASDRLRPSGSYILTPALHGPDWADVEERFKRYRHYLESIGERLPQGAKGYALGPYHNCGGRECPHDSWLEELRMEVRATGGRSQYRAMDLHVRFLGSYHDGYIEFHYRNVHDYLLTDGGDWMYDEVRLSVEGRVIHEIRFLADSHWLIECEDFTYEWKPFDL
jgi:hypothetical protein